MEAVAKERTAEEAVPATLTENAGKCTLGREEKEADTTIIRLKLFCACIG